MLGWNQLQSQVLYIGLNSCLYRQLEKVDLRLVYFIEVGFSLLMRDCQT